MIMAIDRFAAVIIATNHDHGHTSGCGRSKTILEVKPSLIQQLRQLSIHSYVRSIAVTAQKLKREIEVGRVSPAA